MANSRTGKTAAGQRGKTGKASGSRNMAQPGGNARSAQSLRRGSGSRGTASYAVPGSGEAVLYHSQHRKGRSSAIREAALRDYTLIFILMFLISFGLVMLYSTSSYEAAIDFGDGAFYLKRQAISSAVGLVAMLIASRVPYHLLEKFSVPMYFASLALVGLIIPFGREVNGAKRWIYFGPISLQPAEVSKIAVIILTASLICRMHRWGLQTFRGMLVVMLPAVVQGVMIWKITNNLSSAIIIVGIAAGMFFVATKDYSRFFILGGTVAAAAYAIVQYIWMRADSSMDFRSERILAWREPAKYAEGKGFQTLQALYGIGSGGIFGKGLGQSMQKLGYVPEAQNDMIFSIICEELGMFGAVSIIVMFIILCWRLMTVAQNAEDLYGSLIAVGAMTHIAVQVILNIAVVTNTIPNTGVSLPFISYGGSSVLFLLAEMGIVINVSRSIRLKEM